MDISPSSGAQARHLPPKGKAFRYKKYAARRAAYFLSIISYLLSVKIPLFSTSENRGIFYSSTSFTSGSPKANARAFYIVVMAMLCIAVRVKNAWWLVMTTFGKLSKIGTTSFRSTVSEKSSNTCPSSSS